ncbi:MAG: TolB family protein [Myxococcales bacterium]
MLLLALVLLAADAQESLADKLRHLTSAGAAWAPAPSRDASRVAFLTTLFGTRQAASMRGDGGYPTQLTDEPGGVLAVRYLPPETGHVAALANRAGRVRILLLDDSGAPPDEIDPAPGDQYLGGFSRDGKRLFYAVVDKGTVSLRIWTVDTRKPTEVAPPPPAAGVQPAPGTLPIAEVLAGLFALGPPSADGRSILALVQRGQGEALALVDLVAGRGELLTVPGDKPARFRQPRFAPDGKTIYVLTDEGRATLGVDSIVIQGKARKTVYAPAQNIEAFAVTEDGHRLAVAAESGGETLFSLLQLPSLRAEPLAAPPSGALAAVYPGESPLAWDKTGERLFFSWRLADDTTDVWELRLGYGTPLRLTQSPRPGLAREAIPRPVPVKVHDLPGLLWRPPQPAKPRVAVLISAGGTRPVFDKRIAALNFAGIAVLAVNGPGAQAAARAYLKDATDLDAQDPLLLDLDGLLVEGSWGGVVVPPGKQGGLSLDPEQPDLDALVKYARRSSPGL